MNLNDLANLGQIIDAILYFAHRQMEMLTMDREVIQLRSG